MLALYALMIRVELSIYVVIVLFGAVRQRFDVLVASATCTTSARATPCT